MWFTKSLLFSENATTQSRFAHRDAYIPLCLICMPTEHVFTLIDLHSVWNIQFIQNNSRCMSQEIVMRYLELPKRVSKHSKSMHPTRKDSARERLQISTSPLRLNVHLPCNGFRHRRTHTMKRILSTKYALVVDYEFLNNPWGNSKNCHAKRTKQVFFLEKY